MDMKNKVAIISSNLGSFDKINPHMEQSIPFDYFLFTDENFPPRSKAMTPRLQARIPKCFGWQLVPGYDYYLWIDGNLTLKHRDSLKYFLDSCQGYDLVALQHHRRPNIRQEVRYIRKGMRQESMYLIERYNNELLKEQHRIIQNDKDYIDDMLLLSGVFMYRNTPEVQTALKEWWYHITRYHIVDQIGFVYSIKNAGLKINKLMDIYNDCWYLGVQKHKYHAK